MLRELLQVRSDSSLDGERLDRLIRERLRAVLSSASETPYYSRSLGKRPVSALLDDFTGLPVTEKESLRADPASFRSGRGPAHEALTTGSSGIPMKILIDGWAARYRKALLFWMLHGYGRAPLDLSVHIISTPAPGPFRRSSFHGLYPTLSAHAVYDERSLHGTLVRSRAKILISYPSLAEAVAKLNRSGGGSQLKFIVSGGERLHAEARALISESFRAPVHDLYACWEFGPIASECPGEGALHINSGSVLLEILDGRGRPKKSGTGDVVVTSLVNRAMPLIRYRLGDRASFGKPCPCGSPLPTLASVEGRSDDSIILPSGKERSCWSFSVTGLPAVIRRLRRYQLVQENESSFVFRYVSDSILDRASSLEIEGRIRQAAQGEPIEVWFERCDRIAPSAGGKLRSVISKAMKKRDGARAAT